MTEIAETLKKCPFCAELVQAEAKKCKHCGETIDVVLRIAEEAKRNQAQNVVVNTNNTLAGEPLRKSFPHVLHLVGCLFTGGLWLPIWILHYLGRDRKVYL